MTLVEREHVLDQLADVFAESTQGRGRVVHIGGPGASGKTALVRAFGDHVVEAGGFLLTATCSRAERMVPGGVLSQLMSQLPEALEIERPDTDIDPAQLAKQVPAAVKEPCDALLELAKTRTVALVVDDVEFADVFTLQALLYLQRRIGQARITVVLTESDHARQVTALFRAELTRTPWFTSIRLAPLSPRGVAQIVATELDSRTSSRHAPAYHAITGGNPLLVKALIVDHQDADGVTTGEAFRQAVLACLHRWDPALLDVVRAVAVLGENADPELIGRLLGRKTNAVSSLLTALDRAGLLDDGRFRHPAVRAAVLCDMGSDDLAGAHQRAAALLYAEGLPSADVATHLIAGGSSAPWMVGVLRDAAERALTEHRLEFAVECLKLARTACGDDLAGQAALTAALAAAQWRTTPSVVVRNLTALREASERGHLGVVDSTALLRYQLWHGRRKEAADTLRRLEDAAAERLNTPAAAEQRVMREWVRRQHPAVALAAPPANGDQRCAIARDHHDELVASAERVLRHCWGPCASPEAAVHALLTLAQCGEIGRAKQRCETLSADANIGHSPTWKAALADVRAHIALLEGDLDTAERQARLALNTLSPHDWGTAIASPLAALVLACAGMGKHDEAESTLRQAVPAGVEHTWHWPVYLRARGHAHLAAGRPHAALADFEAAGELAMRWDLDLPVLLPWRSDLAEAHARLGRTDRAGELIRKQLELPTADGKRVRGVALRVWSASIDLKQRLPMLREAVALLQSCGDQAELAVALAALSATHYALGEFGASEVVAKRAVSTAEPCRSEPVVRRILPRGLVLDDTEAAEEDTVEETVQEPDDFAVLSTAERRVAALAALGHTNREISRMLYITISTVEQHLTRVYRKLKVRRRADLAAGLPLGDALDFWAGEAPTQSPTPASTPTQRTARDPWRARSTSGSAVRR